MPIGRSIENSIVLTEGEDNDNSIRKPTLSDRRHEGPRSLAGRFFGCRTEKILGTANRSLFEKNYNVHVWNHIVSRTINYNIESKIFLSDGMFFHPIFANCVQAIISSCSRFWMWTILSAKCSKFDLDCDWNNEFSENIQNLVFCSKKVGFLKKSLDFFFEISLKVAILLKQANETVIILKTFRTWSLFQKRQNFDERLKFLKIAKGKTFAGESGSSCFFSYICLFSTIYEVSLAKNQELLNFWKLENQKNFWKKSVFWRENDSIL